jgi:hypothetical protein
MEIPLCIESEFYTNETVTPWQSVWNHVCKMAYENEDHCEFIITLPNGINIGGNKTTTKSERVHGGMYEEAYPLNRYEITLDYMWKKYNETHKEMPHVVPQLKRLHVPKALFESLGVRQWFEHSFPNCLITYWDF